MAYNLGSAYIQVVPTTKGFGRDLEKELGGVGGRASKSVGGKLFGGLKVAAVGAGGAIAGVLGGSIAKGFNRLRDIENAEAKLTGLGHSAETVEGVMKNALASVKGTAFGLGDAASLAGTLVASGIKPGKELERTLKLTADSATIAGRELGDMGLIWGSVAAKGKLQGDDAMQLLASGVPIWQMVGDVMGKTAGEAQELGSKGQVSFEIFQKAMEKGVGGAALESGKTTEGAFKNMGAAMGRFGATLLKDIYPLIGPVFGKITEWFDYLEGAAGPVMETITGKIAEFGKGIKGVWDVLVGGNFTGADNLFGFEEDSAFVDFLFKVRDGALELYERALKPLGMFIKDNIIPIFAGLGAGALYAGITAVVGAISAAIAAAGGISGAIAGVVGAIAWVPLAIGAAVAALVWFFRETETGQAIFGRLVSFVRDTLVPGIVGAFTLVRDFVVGQLWPMFKSRFEAIRDLAVQVWQGVIQPAFEQFAGYVQQTMMPIIQKLWTEYVQPAFMAIGALAVWLWNNAVKPAMSAIDYFIGNVLGPSIVWLWQNVVSPIFGLIGKFIGWVWKTLIFPYLDAMKFYLTVILPAVFSFLWEVAKKVWAGISAAIGATVNWIKGTAVPFIQAAWTLISNSAKWLWGVFVTVWNGIKGAVRAVVSWFQTWVWPVIQMVIRLIQIGFQTLKNALGTIWATIRDNVIKPVVNWFQNTAWPLIRAVIDAIKLGFNVMRSSLSAAWQFVKNNVIAPVVNWFKNVAWPLLSNAIGSIKTAFNTMRDSIKNAWNFVKNNVISPVANWFRDTIRPLFDRSTDGVSNAFTSMKDSIKKSWEAVKSAAKAPIKFVVETVVNRALIGNFNKLAEKLGTKKLPNVSLPAGFARGGVLPGMSRMRDGDDQLVPMRKGEGVLVSEGLRTREDRQAFLAANAAGRRGIGFASLMQGGFAGGGIFDGVKDMAGHAWDKVTDAASWMSDAITDPGKIFTGFMDKAMSGIPGSGVMLDVAKAVPKRIVSAIKDGLSDAFGGALGGGGAAGPVGKPPAGSSRSLSYARQVASSYGLTMTSHFRRGARTKRTGSVSLHASGRAMDFSNSGSPTPQMMAFFNAMHPLKPTELLYSPAGGRQWRRWGAQQDTTGSTKRGHYNHVHVGFHGGGWTGPGSKYQPAGVVHADEHVIRKESRASIERARPGFLDRLNAFGASALNGFANGGLAGYASGGRVSPLSKIGTTRVSVILQGLTGTEKQTKSAAGKLADAITSVMKSKYGASKKSSVNALSDQLSNLRKQASSLAKQARATEKVVRTVGKTKTGKAITRTFTVATSSAKSAASKLADVNKQIASTQKALTAARRGDYSSAASSASSVFYGKYVAKGIKQLEDYANASDNLTSRIKSANKALTDAKKVRSDYAASMAEKFQGTYGLTEDSGNLSVKTLIGDFKLAASKVSTFGSLLTKLRSKGLAPGLVDQIAQLGPDSGTQVAKNILGGTGSQIKQLASAYNKMNSVSKKSASSLAKSMYQTGVDSAQGLVNGLNAQLSKVTKASEKLANQIIKTVRKKLDIHSPSRVFRQIGVYTGRGMTEGIHKVTPEVQSAMARLATPPEAISGDVSVGATGGAASDRSINVHVQAAHGEDPSRIGRRVAESLNLYSLSAAL